MRKINWVQVKDFIVENILFFIMIAITIIFVISPLLLNAEYFSEWVSSILKSLKLEGYKSSYIETLGALLGTFLAVSGALWTQRRENKKKEKHEIKETATIVYYDFKFAFEDIFLFEHAYACIRPGTDNEYDDLEYFIRYRRDIRIYIDTDWISNVAKLCDALSGEELKQIYKIYGDLETIKSVFDKEDIDIEVKDAHRIYHLVYRDLCKLTVAPIVEVNHQEINKNLMNKLEILAKG